MAEQKCEELEVIIDESHFSSTLGIDGPKSSSARLGYGSNSWSKKLSFTADLSIMPSSIEQQMVYNLHLYMSAYGGAIIVPPNWDDFPQELTEESDRYLVQRIELNGDYDHNIHRYGGGVRSTGGGQEFSSIFDDYKKCRFFRPTPHTSIGLQRNDFGATTGNPKKRYLCLGYGKRAFSWREKEPEEINQQSPWDIILDDISKMRDEFSLALTRFKDEFLRRYTERGVHFLPEDLPTVKTEKRAYSIGYTHFEERKNDHVETK